MKENKNYYRKGESDFANQQERVYYQFLLRPQTMLQCSLETGIMRANICRYVAEMRKQGVIQCVAVRHDVNTGFKAGVYTTDKALFRQEDTRQLELFFDAELLIGSDDD